MRTFPEPNSYRTHPRTADDRGFPLKFAETPIVVHQGSAKSVQLGEVVRPFRELYVSDDTNITQIRYKQDAGSWNTVSVGSYASLVQATRTVSFTPEAFGTYQFSLEVTAGSFVAIREVDIEAAVNAGQDKIAGLNASVRAFFDARFAVDSSLLSAVKYSVDGGTDTAIPATFGTDLIDRVKNFSLYWATAGEKKVALKITDTSANESADSLAVRVRN